MFFPSIILINPIDCSYAFEDNTLFFTSSCRDKIFPFFSLYFTILSIFVLVRPETYLSIDVLAVLILTPTLLTHLLTTKSSDSSNFFSFTSC